LTRIPSALVLSLAALVLLEPPPVAAQEVGIGLTRSRSDYLNLPDAEGWIARASSPIVIPQLRLEIARRAVTDRVWYDGQTCDQYAPPPTGCSAETLFSEFSITGWQAGLVLRIPLIPTFDIALGYMRDRTTIEGRIVGVDSERPANDLIPEDSWTVSSWAPSVEVAWTLPSLSRLWARAQMHRPGFPGCAEDIGTPLCPDERIYWFEAGVSLRY
jgi:hypothetical protein